MEALGLLFGLFVFFVWFMIFVPPLMLSFAHAKEKKRKLAMMKEHPEMTAQIFKSMEEDDARVRDTAQKYFEGLSKAVTPEPRKPKSHNGAAMVKLGLGIARRLIK
jgi:hypothetical protein